MRRVFLIALLSAAVLPAERYLFRNFGSGEGLNTSVSQILLDRAGFLWVGTSNGLFRYDGAHFQRFTMDDGLPGVLTKLRAGRLIAVVFDLCGYERGAAAAHTTPDAPKIRGQPIHPTLRNNTLTHRVKDQLRHRM